MIAKIYTDEDVSLLLAELLRKEGVDAVSAYDVGMTEQPDDAQVAYAVQEKRVIITFNIADFSRLARTKDHAGIIVCRQVPLDAYPALTERILDKITLIDEWPLLLVWVSLR